MTDFLTPDGYLTDTAIEAACRQAVNDVRGCLEANRGGKYLPEDQIVITYKLTIHLGEDRVEVDQPTIIQVPPS